MRQSLSPSRQQLLLGLIVAVVLAAAALVWRSTPIEYEMYASDSISYVRGLVVAVNSQKLTDSPDVPGWPLGVQNITVRLTSGEEKGKEVTFDNNLSTTHGVVAQAGLRVIVKADCPEGVAPYYTLYQYDRTWGLCLGALLFLAAMALVGRSKGLRGALGLAVAVILVAGVLVPSIYAGRSPAWTTLWVCLVITTVSLLLLNGFGAKTGAAILAAALGLVGAVVFYQALSHLLHVTGSHLEQAEELILISRSTGLQIGQVLFSGILLSSLGAVMDTTMSVASALYELRQVHPEIGAGELFRSGMTIGGDMIGTMCQTLVLAFAGSSLATLLVLVSYGTQFNQFLSSDLAALEVLQSLTGSLSVIFAVPVTAALCCVLFERRVPAKPGKKRKK